MDSKSLCLQAFLAQAVADAFCYEFEFCLPCGADVDEHWESRRKIFITDDTQMAMFGLFGLGRAKRYINKALTVEELVQGFILPSYRAWYRTQTDAAPEVKLPYVEDAWLEIQPEMRKTRAPGSTCMGSMASWQEGKRPFNNSMGTGAVMRSLPFVFMKDLVLPAPKLTTAVKSGALTHGHKESTCAVALYMAAAEACRYLNPKDLTNHLKFILGEEAKYKNMDAVQRHYGDTFTAFPAIIAAVITLRNALIQDDFKVILTECSVNAGDSDTVAAIAGGLWGLIKPAPKSLLNRLAEKELIEKLVAWTFQGESK